MPVGRPPGRRLPKSRSLDSRQAEELRAGRHQAVRTGLGVMVAAPADPADQLVGDGHPPAGPAADRLPQRVSRSGASAASPSVPARASRY